MLPARHRKVLRIALPAALNSLLDMLQVMTDLVMVGALGAAVVAAVGLGLQSYMFLFAALTLLNVGTSALLSRFVGARRFVRASSALASLLWFAAALSLPFMALWWFVSPQIYVWFGTADAVTQAGQSYVRILTAALPFMFVKMVFVSALNAAGDTKTPMKIKLAGIALNALLDYVLIFGVWGAPKLGVAGAAYATAGVAMLECGILFYLYLRRKTPYAVVSHFSRKLLTRAVRVGLPASIERALTFSSFMLFTAVIAHFGTEALAGYQIGLRVEGLAFMPGIGFTIAAMTLMGQGLGAKDPGRARSDVLTVLGYATALMFALSFFMIFTPEVLVRPFTHDAKVIKEASLYLRIVGLSQIPLAFTFVLSGALRGAGDTKRTLRINLVSLWAFRIIPAFLLAYMTHHIIYVYIAMIVETTLKALWLWHAFQSGKWREVKV
jgi:putative MATE family efflux protein